jgi:hypothetical protein
MAKRIAVVFLVATFLLCAFSYAQARNNNEFNWRNSPQSQYDDHWKNSPLYWRNPSERWFDKYWQRRLSTPIQEIDVILSPKGPMEIQNNKEELKEPVRTRIMTLYEGEEAALSSEDSGPTAGHPGWSIAVYGSEGTDGVYEHVAPRGRTFPGGSIVIYGLHEQ